MAKKRFDATLRQMFERYPRDLSDYLIPALGLPPARGVNVIDADVSTVTAAADKVLRISGRQPWLLHVELLAGHNRRLARQLLLYNVLLDVQHDMPVRTVPESTSHA